MVAREQGSEAGGPGRLARLFCFASGSARVLGEPSRVSRGSKQRARKATQAAAAVPPPPAVAALPPPSPNGTEALAAYFGSHTTPPARPSLPDDSVLQSSTYRTCSSGSGCSGGTGYDGDSDSDWAPPSNCSPASHSTRRFRPAVRHAKSDGEAVPASAAGPEEEAGVQEIVEQFERLSISSGSSSGGRSVRRATRTSEAAAAPVERAVSSICWGSTCTAELHALPSGTALALASQPPSQPPSQSPSRSASSRSSSLSLAPSGSVSLAHFLGRSGSARSLASNSLNSRRLGSMTVRRMGVTQMLLHDSPAHSTKAGAAAADAETTGEPPAAASGSALAATIAQRQPAAAPGAVQRRLSELQSYHFVSLEKLATQAGNFEEPPPSLLSLMARRVFASRSSSLRQALSSQGLLSDLQVAEGSRLQTPSVNTQLASPQRAPARERTPEIAEAATLAAKEQEEAQVVALTPMPQLRRIRTHVGQARTGDGGSSEAGSTGGGAASLNASHSGSGGGGRGTCGFAAQH